MRDIRGFPLCRMTLPLALSLQQWVSIRLLRNPAEPQNEKTRQKAGFSGVSEILKAFSETLCGAAPGVEKNHKHMSSIDFILIDKYYYL